MHDDGALGYADSHPIMQARRMLGTAMQRINTRLEDPKPLDGRDGTVIADLAQVVIAAVRVLEFERP